MYCEISVTVSFVFPISERALHHSWVFGYFLLRAVILRASSIFVSCFVLVCPLSCRLSTVKELYKRILNSTSWEKVQETERPELYQAEKFILSVFSIHPFLQFRFITWRIQLWIRCLYSVFLSTHTESVKEPWITHCVRHQDQGTAISYLLSSLEVSLTERREEREDWLCNLTWSNSQPWASHCLAVFFPFSWTRSFRYGSLCFFIPHLMLASSNYSWA